VSGHESVKGAQDDDAHAARLHMYESGRSYAKWYGLRI
jgi:hypothetical protein